MSEDKIKAETAGNANRTDLVRLLLELSEENDVLRAQLEGASRDIRETGDLGKSVETLLSAAAAGLKSVKGVEGRIDALEQRSYAMEQKVEELEQKTDDLIAASARLIEEFKTLSGSIKKMSAFDRMRKAEERSEAAEKESPGDFDLEKVLAELDARAEAREKAAKAGNSPSEAPEEEITAANLDEALARRRAEIKALKEAERRSNAVKNGSWSRIFSE